MPARDEGAGTGEDSMLRALLDELADAASGLELIYKALSALVADYGLRDAVAVLDAPGAGRQVFRLGRRPVGAARWLGDPRVTPPGVYTFPDAIDPAAASSVQRVCQVALELDLRRHDASHDALTSLLNRRSFDEMLAQSASRSSRYGWPFAVVLIDLDAFKLVNDQLGHDRGDAVLRSVGVHLRSSLRGGDIAARVGGDEFGLILSNGDSPAVSRLVERLRATLLSAIPEDVGFSAGVAIAPGDGTSAADLYRLADTRLYEDKHRRSREPPSSRLGEEEADE